MNLTVNLNFDKSVCKNFMRTGCYVMCSFTNKLQPRLQRILKGCMVLYLKPSEWTGGQLIELQFDVSSKIRQNTILFLALCHALCICMPCNVILFVSLSVLSYVLVFQYYHMLCCCQRFILSVEYKLILL